VIKKQKNCARTKRLIRFATARTLRIRVVLHEEKKNLEIRPITRFEILLIVCFRGQSRQQRVSTIIESIAAVPPRRFPVILYKRNAFTRFRRIESAAKSSHSTVVADINRSAFCRIIYTCIVF